MRYLVAQCIVLFLATFSLNAHADGPVGDHVNELQAHLDEYTDEVSWLIEQITGMVNVYEKSGAKAAKPEMVVDHWESVKFHSAIESNYIPLYASIWQGLFAVRTAMEENEPAADVHSHLNDLEVSLWQSLGAVKLAAQLQDEGVLQEVATREAVAPAKILVEIKQRLDRVLAKYAEQLGEEAIEIVQDTYLKRFEVMEHDLEELDAELVEEIELGFNVHLPKAIQGGKSIDEVRTIVLSMQNNLDKARSLLKKANP